MDRYFGRQKLLNQEESLQLASDFEGILVIMVNTWTLIKKIIFCFFVHNLLTK